ncbi:hypothetical protein NBCG_00730 [Nocardioidaceae bacterium Broad-1]|nr:hypothetical protein NBCG_00730 [Nocardioidaceae bacterium Broad-1]
MTSLYPTQVTHADEAYRLTATLNQHNGTFDYNELRKSSNWVAGATDDGFRLGGEMEWHAGKRIEKSWNFQFGGPNRSSTGSDPEVGLDPVVYSFETGRIKEPLFDWLQSHGWNHKGFLGRLFAR